MPPQPRHEDDESRSDCSLYKSALIPVAALSIFMALFFAACAAAAVLSARRAARERKQKQRQMEMKIDHFKMLLVRAESKVNCYYNLHGNLPQHADAASVSASAGPTTSRKAPAVPAPNYVPPVRSGRGGDGDAYCSGALQPGDGEYRPREDEEVFIVGRISDENERPDNTGVRAAPTPTPDLAPTPAPAPIPDLAPNSSPALSPVPIPGPAPYPPAVADAPYLLTANPKSPVQRSGSGNGDKYGSEARQIDHAKYPTCENEAVFVVGRISDESQRSDVEAGSRAVPAPSAEPDADHTPPVQRSGGGGGNGDDDDSGAPKMDHRISRISEKTEAAGDAVVQSPPKPAAADGPTIQSQEAPRRAD